MFASFSHLQPLIDCYFGQIHSKNDDTKSLTGFPHYINTSK